MSVENFDSDGFTESKDRAGVTYTSTAGFTDVNLRDPPATASELWSDLMDPWTGDSLTGALIEAVRETVTEMTRIEAREQLQELTGDALGGALPDILLSLTRSDSDPWFWRAITVLPKLRQGRPLGFQSDADDCLAALAPLRAADVTPTVSLWLPQGFRDVDARTRSRWCDIVARLGRVCDVSLVVTGVERAWLASYHREDLPGVSDCWISPRDSGDPAAALDLVGTGSRHARVLQLLADEDTETVAYSRLYSKFSVGRSRVRQVVAELSDVGLVEPFGPSNNRRVELTAFGREFYGDEIAVQRRLGGRVSETGKFSNDSRVIPRTHETPPTPPTETGQDRHRLPSHHEQRYMTRRTAAAALGTGLETGFSVVNYPVEPQADRAEGRWHHEDGRLVVSAEGDNPMQMWTTLALTLADRRTFDQVLTRRRLDESNILDMLTDGQTILRDMRNIGWLPDDVNSYDDLREEFLDAANDLGKQTRKYHEDGDDDRRSSITRDALGLAGAMTQLLDLADVDLVRIVKFPEFSRRFTDDRRDELFRSLAVGTAISSNYGHHVSYRQLFEERTEKRRQAFNPTIDATDPWARPIGSWVLAGDFAGRADTVAEALHEQFNGLDPHEDAPELAIRTTVRTDPTRRQVAETARRMLSAKGLNLTPQATSMLHGLARTPFDVADALHHLAGENDDRRVDAAEIRYALAQLDADRLLRGFDGRRTTPRKLVSALLLADRPIDPAELDNLADVSSRSRRNHLSDLETSGLVKISDRGVRLRLSFRDIDSDDSERYSDIWPAYIDGDPELRPTVHAAAKVLRVGRKHHGPSDDVDDPGWPYTGVGDPLDLRNLSQPWPWLDHILPALWGVRVRDTYRDNPDVVPPLEIRHIEAGPTLEQTALIDTGAKISSH